MCVGGGGGVVMATWENSCVLCATSGTTLTLSRGVHCEAKKIQLCTGNVTI